MRFSVNKPPCIFLFYYLSLILYFFYRSFGIASFFLFILQSVRPPMLPHPPKASSGQEEEAVRKGLGDIMGGKVLELESERLKAEGQAIGRAEGQAIGQAQGKARLGSLINRLIQEQRIDEIQVVSTDSERRDQLYKEYNL